MERFFLGTMGKMWIGWFIKSSFYRSPTSPASPASRGACDTSPGQNGWRPCDSAPSTGHSLSAPGRNEGRSTTIKKHLKTLRISWDFNVMGIELTLGFNQSIGIWWLGLIIAVFYWWKILHWCDEIIIFVTGSYTMSHLGLVYTMSHISIHFWDLTYGI